MRILIVGQNEQMSLVFKSLDQELELDELSLVFLDPQSLPNYSLEDLIEFIDINQIGAVIYSCGFVNIYQAQDPKHKSEVFLWNSALVRKTAEACQACSIPLVYYSSSHVFDGSSTKAYTEKDQPNPLSIYGQSKFEAEKYLQNHFEYPYIIRTSSVFSRFGRNPLNLTLQNIDIFGQVELPFNNILNVTSARSLAITTINILFNQESIPFGLFNYTSKGCIQFQEFCEEVIRLYRHSQPAKVIVGDMSFIKEVGLDPLKPIIPAFSCLDSSKVERSLNMIIPNWKDELNQEFTN